MKINSNFIGKNDVILLENSTFHELEVFIELMFRYFYQFNIFALNESEA